MRRRAFLVACAATGLAGCRTDDAGTDGAGTDGAPGRSDPTAERTTDGTDPSTASPTATEGATQTPSPSPTATATATTETTPTGTPVLPGYEATEVRVTTPDGERLGAVTAAVADTPELRYTGLSDTERLPEDRGMLFVYDTVDDHTYVMREMDYGLDIVYADDEGVITRIHHAPAPGPDEDGADRTYPGRGQYVLEVNYEWTTDCGVETGDVLRFDL